MHNSRIKFKEEQIKKLAHLLTAESELKKNFKKKKAARRKRDECILPVQWGYDTKSSGLRQILLYTPTKFSGGVRTQILG